MASAHRRVFEVLLATISRKTLKLQGFLNFAWEVRLAGSGSPVFAPRQRARKDRSKSSFGFAQDDKETRKRLGCAYAAVIGCKNASTALKRVMSQLLESCS
jgi:hypothetical protein